MPMFNNSVSMVKVESPFRQTAAVPPQPKPTDHVGLLHANMLNGLTSAATTPWMNSMDQDTMSLLWANMLGAGGMDVLSTLAALSQPMTQPAQVQPSVPQQPVTPTVVQTLHKSHTPAKQEVRETSGRWPHEEVQSFQAVTPKPSSHQQQQQQPSPIQASQASPPSFKRDASAQTLEVSRSQLSQEIS